MRVLVVGAGAREHALAWRLATSASVDAVFAAPGNPGIEEVAEPFPSRPTTSTGSWRSRTRGGST